MADNFNTEAEINVTVTGDASLTRAADNAAKLENTLRNVAQAAGEMAKQLDKAQNNAFAQSNANTAKTSQAAAAAITAQARALGTLNQAAAKQVQTRTAAGQFGPNATTAQKVGAQLAINAQAGLAAQGASEINRARATVTDFDRKQNQTQLRENLSYLNQKKSQTLAEVQAERQAVAQAFGGTVAKGQNSTGAAATAAAATKGLTSTSYALLNLSLILGTIGVGLTAIDVQVLKTAIDFQKSFAEVQRTVGLDTQPAINALKQSLIDLSTSIPVSFDDIAKIATLGGQLDIGASSIDNFSQTVAEFSATTDVATEDAATSLGRLGQLLPDVAGNYDKLGSSILKVGVNSVATESQIIAIATNIAGVARAVGLTTPEVIGLSGALASIGIQPELARGTVTRLFTNIQIAVAGAGDKLDAFAKVSGESSSEFAAQWKKAPTDAIQALLKGINGSGDQAIETLKGLGIASVRDIPALLRLAQSGTLLSKALADANSGFNDGTELGKQFSIIAETVAAKIQVLQNNFQAFLNAIGSSATGPLGTVIDVLNGIVGALTKIAQNPVGQAISLFAVIVTGLVGVLVTLIGTVAAASGSFLLLQAALDSSAISAGVAAGAMTAFKVALIGTGIGAVVVLLGTLTAGLLQAGGVFDKVGDKGKAFFGSLDTLTVGLQQDQGVYEQTGNEIGSITVAMDNATDATTKSTIAYGANAQAALKSALANNQAFQQLFTDSSFSSAGANSKNFIDAILGDPVHGADEYLAQLKAALKAKYPTIGQNVFTGELTAPINDKAAKAAADGYDNIASAAKNIKDGLLGAAGAASVFGDADNTAAAAAGDLSASVTDAAGKTETLGKSLLDQIDNLYEAANASAQLASDTESLGEAFINNGADAASSGSELQAVIADIVSSSATTGDAANQLQGFFDALVNGGFASADKLNILQQVILTLGGATKSTAFDMSGFTAGQNKARTAIQKTGSAAAKQVKTLVDYANDLKGVLDRAFDLQFGGQTGFDKITSQFISMQQEVDDTNKSVRDLQNTLQQNLSDVGILQYFKSVADAYGDTLRSADLASQIADLNATIADNSSDLAKAQAKQTKTTIGNSEAAVDNRSDLLDLLGSYKDYIGSLASAGLNQQQLASQTQQLKQQFIAQATSLGYNATQVQAYASAFDNLTQVINGVPRSITVTANTDPAIQALNEFVAKAATAGAAAGGAFASSFGDPAAAVAAKIARANAINNRIATLMTARAAATGAQSHGYDTTIQALINQLASGNFAKGGIVRGPGSGTSDSIFANLSNGEFVVNAAATDANRSQLNYLNKTGRLPTGPGKGAPAIQLVELVASDKALLAQLGNIQLKVGENVISAATNNVAITNNNRGTN